MKRTIAALVFTAMAYFGCGDEAPRVRQGTPIQISANYTVDADLEGTDQRSRPASRQTWKRCMKTW